VPGRTIRYLSTYASQIAFTARKRPYSYFAGDARLSCQPLPSAPITGDWKAYHVYSHVIDLTAPVDWYFADGGSTRWPQCHHGRIDYAPGSAYGDIRTNWELNRLQFLPMITVTDEGLARSLLEDWFAKTPYLQGPSYLSSMEVALRWISVYWAVCLLKEPLDDTLRRSVEGLAVLSGKFIERRLSTHSSAGNHIVIEALGLFWLGRALAKSKKGVGWLSKGRHILWEQILRQILSDGTGREQSVWYLGFVLDAFFHYLLLEDREIIPKEVLERVEKALDFINELTFQDGTFFDFGDRDDGFVFRTSCDYGESPFPGLLNLGTCIFERGGWFRHLPDAAKRFKFWGCDKRRDLQSLAGPAPTEKTGESKLMTYRDGGVTLARRGDGRLLFRHSRLGLEPTFGHGHADALSILLFWKDVPVLIDPGTGRYNGDKRIRNYFRSTIAHNTVEIEGIDQAKILGPFMWDRSYECVLSAAAESPFPAVEAYHDAYEKKLGLVHVRRVEWPAPNRIEIWDRFMGPDSGLRCRGAFHMGDCKSVDRSGNEVLVVFHRFSVLLTFPDGFEVVSYRGSLDPFVGWRSTLYGKVDPADSILYSFKCTGEKGHRTQIEIRESGDHFTS